MNTIAIVGLGYVGLGLAVAFSKHYSVLGYDIAESRIKELQENYDRTNLNSREDLAESKIHFTTHINDIKNAEVYIVVVSTPAYENELPDLRPLEKATSDLARVLKKGDIVIFESTVYPGTTEDICLPLLEKESNLQSGKDFFIGYSPERINPNDKVHTLKTIPKIVSAQDKKTLKLVKTLYESICDKVYPVANIKTAEAVKILENTQRDVNIAFMNEFTQIMHSLKLNMREIIEAAKTKWSFAHYNPGLVGGHCIAVDPLYLAYKAKRLGVDCDITLTARKVNNNVTRFLLQELKNLFLKHNIDNAKSTIGVFGLTYKENIPDLRNSLALKFINELKSEGYNLQVHDPLVEAKTVKEKYNIELMTFDSINNLSAAILLVAHDEYKKEGFEPFISKLKTNIFMDIPNLFIEEMATRKDIDYWSL